MAGSLPSDAASRKAVPLASGLFDYFPDALIAVASLSHVANEQHHPGEPLHWDRNKSTDHDDCLLRHFVERGTVDTDGVRHRTKVAWRALAALQEEVEAIQTDARLVDLFRKKAPWESADPNADTPAQSPHDDFTIAQDPPDLPHGWLEGVPAESSYLDSFGPNGSRLATEDEVAGLREHLTAEQLREYGIGDVPHRPNARNAHPMAAEALRQHDERLNGPEDSL